MSFRAWLPVVVLAAAGQASGADSAEPWEKATCRPKDMDFPIVDFHAHTFNFRHLPLQGILYGWGAPEFVADVAGEMLWRMTGRGGEGADRFAALRYEPGTRAFARPFRDRALAASIDWFALPEEPLDAAQRERFERELDAYLVDEMQYESLPSGLRETEGTPLTDYFVSLAAADSRAAGFSAGGASFASREAMLQGMQRVDLLDKLTALLIKPFRLLGRIEGAFRFLGVMTQPEDKLVRMLLEDNCSADYFVHHMMDLEHVYDDTPPVRFHEQHDVVRGIREANGERLITFTAFVPFRYDDFNLEILDHALSSGAVGVKYYPPSGYNARVETIPRKPGLFRGLIYQGGARAQWHHRYDPLSDATTRANWGIEVEDPRRARQETLSGISARFLAFAAERRLPVFAHHTPEGFEAQPGYGRTFAEPCTWLPVLEENPSMQLVLGHSGGDAWYSDDSGFDASIARQAFNLCVSYENVYCDFGYHEDVLADAGQQALHARLLAMHGETLVPDAPPLTAQMCRSARAPMKYAIFDKLLYGSDWMMVVKESGHEKLIAAFDKVFTGELEDYAPAFFGGNALKVLRASGNSASLPGELR